MRLLRVLLLILVLLALAGLALYQYRILPSVASVGGVGDEIRLDDFGATLLGSSRVSGVGEGPSRVGARGMFVIVNLRIANHAQRVDFQFQDEYVRLVDAAGHEYPVAPEAQKYLRTQHANPCSGSLSPGGMCTTELVYDVPPEATGLQLRMKFADGVLDMVDTILYGKQRLNVP